MVDFVNKNRIFYRISQFFSVIFSKPDKNQLLIVNEVLDPDQLELFIKLQSSEQMHAIHTMTKVEALGFTNSEYLKAALLHDVGKIVNPLTLLERIMIVIWRKLFPKSFENLSDKDLEGWKRGLVISRDHPKWGAELISNTDLPESMIFVVRNHHQRELQTEDVNAKDFFLALKSIDDMN